MGVNGHFTCRNKGFFRYSIGNHSFTIAGGIPNIVAAGKAVLKDWNRCVFTSNACVATIPLSGIFASDARLETGVSYASGNTVLKKNSGCHSRKVREKQILSRPGIKSGKF